ncbi:MAG: hypothetical protein KC502_06495 [Myxococcales bacterium]|nr:hypothetical protein [Myxococcales bacterium]
MSHRLFLPICLLVVAVGTLGCSTDSSSSAANTRTGPWWVCPPVKGPGLEHGRKCATNADCMYGHCFDSGFLAGYVPGIKFCTKNNGCTGGDSSSSAACSTDGAFASAFEKSTSGGNAKRTSPEPYKVCAKTCASDAECANWNIEMPDCIKSSTDYVSMGTKGVCGVNPFK